MNMRNSKWAISFGAALFISGVAAQTLTLTGPDGQTRQLAQTTSLQNVGTGFGTLAQNNNAVRSAGQTRTVRSNETLWRIANEVQPDEGVTVYQVMLALFQANPHAFSEDNLNSLERNMVLTVPSRSTMASIPAEAAKARAVNDDKVWRSGSRGSSAPATPSGGSALDKLKAENAALTAQVAELSKAKTDLEQQVAQQAGQPADPEELAALRIELDSSVSELTLTIEQNEMLKRRVDELSAENGELKSALEEQQNLNRQLQQQLDEKPEPEPLPPPPPPSFWQTLSNNVGLLLLVGILPALLVGLVAFFFIRRQSKQLADENAHFAPVEPVVETNNDAQLEAPQMEKKPRAAKEKKPQSESDAESLSLDDLLAAHEKHVEDEVGQIDLNSKMFDDADIEALLSDSSFEPREKAEPKPAAQHKAEIKAEPQPALKPEVQAEQPPVAAQPAEPAAPLSDNFIDIESLLDDSNINKTGSSDSRYDDGSQSASTDYVEDESTVNAKLDLARAYIEIADFDSAKSLLKEVTTNGNSGQKAEAEKLLAKL